MSDVPAHDVHTSGQDEPETVFARLVDAPTETLQSLIEQIEARYTDLNAVFAHSYWGDLVLHHSAVLRSLGEARQALHRFRSEALGAYNTERGVSVSTLVRGDQHHHAHTDAERADLLAAAFTWDDELHVATFYAWDRPFTDPEQQVPDHSLRVVTLEDWAAVTFSRATDDGELHTWHALPTEPDYQAPVLRLAPGSRHTFVPEVVGSLQHAQATVGEYLHTATCPTTVSWQEPRWR